MISIQGRLLCYDNKNPQSPWLCTHRFIVYVSQVSGVPCSPFSPSAPRLVEQPPSQTSVAMEKGRMSLSPGQLPETVIWQYVTSAHSHQPKKVRWALQLSCAPRKQRPGNLGRSNRDDDKRLLSTSYLLPSPNLGQYLLHHFPHFFKRCSECPQESVTDVNTYVW